jgi:uncharacterized protein
MSKFAISIIRWYQYISVLTPKQCRFYPSCSEYMIQTIELNGLAIGLLHGGQRICKCHPFHPGGVDLPRQSFLLRRFRP